MKNKLDLFFNSYFFIGITFFIAILNWALGTYIIAFPYYIISIIFIILFDIKRINIIPLVFAAIISFVFSNMKENVIIVGVGGVIITPFIIYDIYKQKIDFKNSILIAMFVVFISILCSARFAVKASYVLIGIAQYLCYIFFFCYALIVSRGDKKSNQEYIAKNMIFLGFAIAIEVLIFALRSDDLSFIQEKNFQLGWGFANSISFIYLIIIFFTLYLYVLNQKKWYLLLFLVLYFYMIVIMQSRSVWGIGLIVAIPTLIWLIYKSKDKKKTGLLIGGVAGISILISILLIFFTDLFAMINARYDFSDLLDMKDRLPIYYKGMEVFLKHPIYGAGVFTSSYYLNPVGLSRDPTYILLNNYHNYLIQTLATTGFVGLGAFLYWLYCIFKKLLIKDDFNIIVLLIMFSMLLNGLVSTTFYEPIIMLIMLVVWANITEIPKEAKSPLESIVL